MPWLVYLGGLRPVDREVAGSVPSQDTCLGCGPGPQLGGCGPGPQLGAWERQLFAVSLTHHVSLPLFLPPFPSL